MRIVGAEPLDAALDTDVHTVDVWRAAKPPRWYVQRLNGKGEPLGPAHRCRTEAEARACLADWLRRHPETHLATPTAPRRSIPRGG